jgi:hypothetical protein
MDSLKVDGGALYQWDSGRRIEVTSTINCTVDEVEFENPYGDAALVVELKTEGDRIFAPIPNILLQRSGHLIVYAVTHSADGKQTIRDYTFGINTKQKPSDYVYTETEVYSIKTALEKALREAKESGDFTGPEGKQGPEGKPGEDGKPGKDGVDGQDGYTPQKGVDYYTDAEKAELIEEVRSDINEIAEGKVDKVTTPASFRRVYAIDETGTQDVISIDNGYSSEEDVMEGGVAIRNANHSIYIPREPVEDTDAVNKAYIDTRLGDISTILTALHEGGIE